MPLAETSWRGFALYARLAVNGIQKDASWSLSPLIDRLHAEAGHWLVRPKVQQSSALCDQLLPTALDAKQEVRQTAQSRHKDRTPTLREAIAPERCRTAKNRAAGWRLRGGFQTFNSRQPELVSASMAGPCIRRGAEGNGRPWTLKQVQGDDAGWVSFRSFAVIRHPGLDPGSTAELKSWAPDQVRGDDDFGGMS